MVDMASASGPAFTLARRNGPLVVSMPHGGTLLGADLARRLAPDAFPLADTDWHLDRLYDFLPGLDATLVAATHSRFYIDLNRPPDDRPLYPGQFNTGLCPVDRSDGGPIYRPGAAPAAAEIATRRAAVWQPYHDALAAELERVRAIHGYALLWDAHSIPASVPRLFDGVLPDMNIGTAHGAACGPGLGEAALAAVPAPFTSVLNGRFVGGYITRHHGQPARRIHAVQMELVRATYMEEGAPFRFRADLAAGVRPALRCVMEGCLAWGAAHGAA
jgi:N-formylglutamate deformylase